MRSFKTYLTESTQLSTKEEVKQWLLDNCSSSYLQGKAKPIKKSKIKINSDLSVDMLEGGSILLLKKEPHIPVKFNHVDATFRVSEFHPSSWDFLPTYCDTLALDEVGINELPSQVKEMNTLALHVTKTPLTSFKNMPDNLQEIIATDLQTRSLIGIETHIKRMKSHNGDPTMIRLHLDEITEGGIGFLLIEGLDRIYSWSTKPGGTNELPEPFKIIRDHLRDKDVFACQQELIEKGYEAYAQL